MFIHSMFIFKRKAYRGFCLQGELPAWPLFISAEDHDQDKFEGFIFSFLDAKRPVCFPLEEKHVVNEHHVERKRF